MKARNRLKALVDHLAIKERQDIGDGFTDIYFYRSGGVTVEAKCLLRDVSDASEFLVGDIELVPNIFSEVRRRLGQVDEVGDGLKRIVDLVRDGGRQATGGSEFLGLT